MTTSTQDVIKMPTKFVEQLGTVVPDVIKDDYMPAKCKGNFALLMAFENNIYASADKLSSDYSGGYWDIIETKSKGFFFSLGSDKSFDVETAFGSRKYTVDGHIFGIIATIMTASNLSFAFYQKNEQASQICSDIYHKLRNDFYSLVDEALENDELGYSENEKEQISKMSEAVYSVLD